MNKTRLIFINGTMGAGKTTVCRLLQQKLPANVFLDGDDLWNMQPFLVNAATKNMVLNNIGAVLENFLSSGQFDNALFCWVMHEREIADGILSRLHTPFDFRFFTLTCEQAALAARLERDIAAGKRTRGVIERSAERAVSAAGGAAVSLDAQVRAAGFYEKCGYFPVGEIFDEEGCPHRKMVKKL